MARPPAKVFEEFPHGNQIEQIVDCEGVFAVLYNGKPFQLRHCIIDLEIKTYGRSLFPNKAHAIRLAKRLNGKFKTGAFTVEQLL